MQPSLKRTSAKIAMLAITASVIVGSAHAQMPPPPSSNDGNNSASLGFGNQTSTASPNTNRTASNGFGNTNTNINNNSGFSHSPMGGIQNNAVRQSQNQAEGNYGGMNRNMGSVPLGMVQNAWDSPRANMAQGQIAPGVVRFQWSPPLVMQLHLRDFMVTTVIFPKWEQITELFVGDRQSVTGKLTKPNIIMFQNKENGIDTTATAIAKSGNVYQFYLRAEGTNTKKITDVTAFVDVPNPNPNLGEMGVVNNGNFNEGTGQTNSIAGGESLGQPQLGPTIPGAPGPNSQDPAVTNPDMIVPRDKMVFNMRLYDRKGHPEDMEIAPEFVYTDGVWTYFNFGSKSRTIDRPVVRRVIDGVETTVNSRTEGPNGEILVAEALGDFTLRNGSRVICVKRIK